MTEPHETDERRQIRTAIDRLLSGQPLRSTGELTVVQLASEAGVKRWRLTHQHPDLMQRFQAAARQQSQESPLITAWRERVEDLQAQILSLREENTALKATMGIYAQVIDDLSLAAESSTAPGPGKLRRVQ